MLVKEHCPKCESTHLSRSELQGKFFCKDCRHSWKPSEIFKVRDDNVIDKSKPMESNNKISDFFDQTKAIVTDRRAQYGSLVEEYKAVSGAFTALTKIELKPEHIGLIMMLIKMERTNHTTKEDSFIDICGYASGLNELFNDKK